MRDIRDLTIDELRSEFRDMGEPAFRADQAFSWIYRKGSTRFDQFTNFPKPLREKLLSRLTISGLDLHGVFESHDGVRKLVFRLRDGEFIETVLIHSRRQPPILKSRSKTPFSINPGYTPGFSPGSRMGLIPAGPRRTVCVSTQVGCKFGCVFCASGRRGFIRNLTPGEMTGQFLFLRDDLDIALTNIVFMGMGEPLDNIDALDATVRILNAPEGLNFAARRITVSTAGVVPGIERLAALGLQINLSVSLHAATPEKRERLMPIEKKYPLDSLLRACEHYIRVVGRMITLEYVLLEKINDTTSDADALAKVARRLKAKVNLILFSPVPGLAFEPPNEGTWRRFLTRLEAAGIQATLRQSKGRDIQAACGQLAGRLGESR